MAVQASLSFSSSSSFSSLTSFSSSSSFSCSASSSSSSSSSSSFLYEVFLSYCEQDTGIGFTGYLYDYLVKRGIRTFFNEDDLKTGEQITPPLLDAIENSKIAIPVFSENYAASSFCLDELVYILECVKGQGRLVLPVFYYVDPSDLRRLKGKYGEALAEHDVRFKANQENLEDNMERLQKWRQALPCAAGMIGLHFRKGVGNEVKFIRRIFKRSIRILMVLFYMSILTMDSTWSDDWDPMKLECQLTYPECQIVPDNQSNMSDRSCHGSDCLCDLISSVVLLCSSSSSLDIQ